jgi:hypothetical protein
MMTALDFDFTALFAAHFVREAFVQQAYVPILLLSLFSRRTLR